MTVDFGASSGRMLTLTTRTEPISGLKRALLENGLLNHAKMGRSSRFRAWVRCTIGIRESCGGLPRRKTTDNGVRRRGHASGRYGSEPRDFIGGGGGGPPGFERFLKMTAEARLRTAA
jgi:hypothetical protein